MRILVTGGDGTLGRVLVPELQRRGHAVVVCDIRHSHKENYIRTDITNLRQLERVFEKHGPFDLVYHLAAEFGRNNGEDYFEQLWMSNAIGTRNVIEMCIKFDVRLVFASSSEAYGESSGYIDQNTVPLEERFLDTYVPAFHNEYALTKWTNEKQIHIAAANRGLKAVVLRFFNAYGPGEFYSPYRSVVCLFIYRVLNGLPITVFKNYHRVFMWVHDWAVTVANVADRFDTLPRSEHRFGARPGNVPTYNIGGEEFCSVETMKEILVDVMGGKSERLSDELEIVTIPDGTKTAITYLAAEKANITNKRPDITLAKLDLDHDPKVRLVEGLPPTVEWMKRTYATSVAA